MKLALALALLLSAAPGVEEPRVEHHVEEVEEGRLKLRYETSDTGATELRLLEPEGARAELWESEKKVAEGELPLTFAAKPGAAYRAVVLSGADRFERRLVARAGNTLSVWVAAPRPARPPANDDDMAALTTALGRLELPAQRLTLLRAVAARAWFTCEQAGALLELFEPAPARLEALEALRGRLSDRACAADLAQHFEGAEREKAAKLLR